MSKLLDFLREGYNNPDFRSLKEWATPYGEMGVYELIIVDELGRGKSLFLYLAVLNRDGSSWHEQYTHMIREKVLKDAEVIAQFSGALAKGA